MVFQRSSGPPGLVLRPGRCGVNSPEQEVPPEKWQALEALWRAVLGLVASIDTLRLSMDGLLSEVHAALREAVTVVDKGDGLHSDVAKLHKAHAPVHYA